MAGRSPFPTLEIKGLPRAVDVHGEQVTLRVMSPGDATALHTFFVELAAEHPHDLLFLRRDVTSGKEIDDWVMRIASGETVTLLAEADGQVLGEASLDRSSLPWTRHVGAVRVVVDWSQRGRGLSRLLLAELFKLALQNGIERVMAEMMVEQESARGLFSSLGFVEEGRYRAFVRDLDGDLHDLVVMTAGGSELEQTAGGPATG